MQTIATAGFAQRSKDDNSAYFVFGISRDSVSKMLAYSEPPGYRQTAPIKRPKLDPYVVQIDSWLAEDKTRARKQRHTAKKIFERLRDECRFYGG